MNIQIWKNEQEEVLRQNWPIANNYDVHEPKPNENKNKEKIKIWQKIEF